MHLFRFFRNSRFIRFFPPPRPRPIPQNFVLAPHRPTPPIFSLAPPRPAEKRLPRPPLVKMHFEVKIFTNKEHFFGVNLDRWRYSRDKKDLYDLERARFANLRCGISLAEAFRAEHWTEYRLWLVAPMKSAVLNSKKTTNIRIGYAVPREDIHTRKTVTSLLRNSAFQQPRGWVALSSIVVCRLSFVVRRSSHLVTPLLLYIYDVLDYTNHILWKVMIQGPQKQCSWVYEIQIYTWKYTNTNTQILWSKLQICLIWYISKKVIRPRLTSFRM